MLKTTLLLGALTGLLLFIGGMFGGRTGMIFAFVFAMAMNFGSYWFSDRIVLAMYKAKPVTEADDAALYSIVRGLSTRAGLPMPKVYRIPNPSPNAFATGRNPEHAVVAVTDGIRQLLTDEEPVIIQMAVSRSREYQADATGAKIAGNSRSLASALEKLSMASKGVPMAANPSTSHMFIVKPFSGKGLMSLFSTHPPVEKRVAKLRDMKGSL